MKNYDGLFAEQISAVAVSAVALFVLYFVVKILLKFLIGILDLLAKLPIIKTLRGILSAVESVDATKVPGDSILRETIGGSQLEY